MSPDASVDFSRKFVEFFQRTESMHIANLSPSHPLMKRESNAVSSALYSVPPNGGTRQCVPRVPPDLSVLYQCVPSQFGNFHEVCDLSAFFTAVQIITSSFSPIFTTIEVHRYFGTTDFGKFTEVCPPTDFGKCDLP